MRRIRTVLIAAAVFISTLSVAEAQQLYVPNFFDGDVSVVNAATLVEILPRIPIDGDPSTPEIDPSAPEAVAFSPDLAFAFISMDDSDLIAVIDTDTRQVVKYIEGLPGSLETLIFARPGGDRMYVSNCKFPTITVIDVASQEAIDVDPITTPLVLDGIPLPTGSYKMAFSPNGRRGYVGTYGDLCALPIDPDDPDDPDDPYIPSPFKQGIYRLDLVANSYLGFIGTSRDVTGLAVSPKRSANVALATGQDRILVVDLSTNLEIPDAVMCGPDGLFGPDGPCEFGGTNAVAFNPDGTRAYVVDWDRSELVTLDMSAPLAPLVLSRVAITTVTGVGPWEIALSGNRAYTVTPDFVGFSASELVSFDISTDTPGQLLNTFVGTGALQLGVGPLLPEDDGATAKVHGAGKIPGKVHFEFRARITKKGDKKGGCHVTEKTPGPDRKIKCLDVTSLVVNGDTATIKGTATDSAFPGTTTYEITVEDNAKKGKGNDKFSITTGTLFVKAGTLTSGNVTIKP